MGASRDFGSVTDTFYLNNTSNILDPSTTPFTIALWVKLDSAVDGCAVGTNGGGGSIRTILLTNATPRLVANLDGTLLTGVTTMATGVWNFIAVTHDAIGSGTATIYLNGSVENSGTRNPNVSNNGFIFGARATTLAFKWDGEMAYAHMYTRALTASELLEIQYKPGSIVNGLKAFWPLTGGSLLDLSGNGYTLVNTNTIDSTLGPPVSFPAMK